jgi:hypothetical protein
MRTVFLSLSLTLPNEYVVGLLVIGLEANQSRTDLGGMFYLVVTQSFQLGQIPLQGGIGCCVNETLLLRIPVVFLIRKYSQALPEHHRGTYEKRAFP